MAGYKKNLMTKIQAFYSKDSKKKQVCIGDFLAGERGPIIYVYPKNVGDRRLDVQRSFSVSYEDIDKKEQWLHVNSLLGGDAVLVMENPSRYPKATSPKSRALRRLSMQVQTKVIVDIVPFTMDIQYLYTPLSFLSRSILGYAHYYAFRENYQEIADDGIVRHAHDYDVLAEKMKDVCRIDYDGFLLRNRVVVDCPIAEEEQREYDRKKEALFAKEKTPQRIITRLADTAHKFKSRADRLLEVISECKGRTLVLCNLAGYAARAQSLLKKAGVADVVATTYQSAMREDLCEFDNVVYLESPIVKSYYLLDVEAALPRTCRVYHFAGDAKVDQYLYGQIDRELRQIHGLTKELFRVTGL